jgi:hypothetical protein
MHYSLSNLSETNVSGANLNEGAKLIRADLRLDNPPWMEHVLLKNRNASEVNWAIKNC